MDYEYSGFLANLLDKPDILVRDSLPHVVFDAADMAFWNLMDDEAESEWKNIPGLTERTPNGIILRGNFEGVRRIDNIDHNDPSFWVPLSASKWPDARFPIDTAAYPIAEITYRCVTAWARPAWLWHYPGGVHFDGLKPTRTWRTVARRVPYFGMPGHITALTVRLYSTSRSTEAVEIESIRFRAETPEEKAAYTAKLEPLLATKAPVPYPALDSFLPLGVMMNASTAKRMTESLDIETKDYWKLAFEDIARHHHNCVAVEDMEALAPTETSEMLDMAQTYGLRVLGMHQWPMQRFSEEGGAWIEKHIAPHVHSESLLAWTLQDPTPEHTFDAMLDARDRIAEIDTKHPLAVWMREPNSLPLFAPFFPAAGFSYFKGKDPWSIAEMLRTQIAHARGQQFWVQAPCFVYATNTPEWYTCPEMRLLLNLTLANGARGWFECTYHNDPIWLGGHCQRSLTGPFLTFSDLWSELGLRMERFSVLSLLFLASEHIEHPGIPLEITWKKHPRSRCPEGTQPIAVSWVKGPDFTLLYIVSNDISEVTPVFIEVPKDFPPSLRIYDFSDFVRKRSWHLMPHSRHLEMFPGQGQMIMIAEGDVCDKWRDRIIEELLEGDERQLSIDMELARNYNVDLHNVEALSNKVGAGIPLYDLALMIEARAELTNAIYDAPALAEPRSKLIQASAAVCACDGALCRLIDKGRGDLAHEMGLELLPLAREMAHLRLELRQGQGSEIFDACSRLSYGAINLLEEIRNAARKSRG